jgi:hypothetical protein
MLCISYLSVLSWPHIGSQGQNTPRAAYELLAIAAFGALGYHTYYLIVNMNIVQDK